jgi:hypothetical protein
MRRVIPKEKPNIYPQTEKYRENVKLAILKEVMAVRLTRMMDKRNT